jgi:hypothetical protein
MIKVRKLNGKDRAQGNRAIKYVIQLGELKSFLTEKALIELQTKLNEFVISSVLKPLKEKEVLSFEDWRIDCDYYQTVAGNFVKGAVRYTEEETRFKYKTEYLQTL